MSLVVGLGSPQFQGNTVVVTLCSILSLHSPITIDPIVFVSTL